MLRVTYPATLTVEAPTLGDARRAVFAFLRAALTGAALTPHGAVTGLDLADDAGTGPTEVYDEADLHALMAMAAGGAGAAAATAAAATAAATAATPFFGG